MAFSQNAGLYFHILRQLPEWIKNIVVRVVKSEVQRNNNKTSQVL
jgi:hypothetical protein